MLHNANLTGPLVLESNTFDCFLPEVSDFWDALSSSISDLAFLAKTPQKPYLDSFKLFIDVYSKEPESYIGIRKPSVR